MAMFIHVKQFFLIPYAQPDHLQHFKPLYYPPGLPEQEEEDQKQQQQHSKSTKIAIFGQIWLFLSI